MKRTPLKRKTRVNPVSQRRRERSGKPGKLGIVRLYGTNMEKLRRETGDAQGWVCAECKVQCDPDGYGHRPRGEYAHKKGKRNHGDTRENGRILCGSMIGRVGCHQKEHNCGGKPCPAKPKKEAA